jgi:hypothetical protein
MRKYDGKVVQGTDPMGRELYWFTVVPIQGAEEGTDRWAVEKAASRSRQFESISPMITHWPNLLRRASKLPADTKFLPSRQALTDPSLSRKAKVLSRTRLRSEIAKVRSSAGSIC